MSARGHVLVDAAVPPIFLQKYIIDALVKSRVILLLILVWVMLISEIFSSNRVYFHRMRNNEENQEADFK